VAYAIGKRVGGAVERNRLRRRLRGVVGELDLPPGAYLLGAGPEAAELSHEELKKLVHETLEAVARDR
jgi:ribonuclease P protein component